METQLPISLDEQKAELKPLVLIVDDDPVHHKLMELIAERLGFTVHMVSSCGQAIEALSMFSFDLMLMDYRMPDVDGCMCARRIREMKEIKHDIAIIAVTAHVMKGSSEECLEAGMDDFLQKPFTLEELHNKVSYWLQKKTE
jgi:two-component system, sensor histidine kinase and response regulator